MATLAQENIGIMPSSGVSAFFRGKTREVGVTIVRETSEPAFMRDMREKVAVAEQSVGAGRVMDGFESLKTVRMKQMLKEFIATAPRNVPLTDDDIMEEIRQVRRDAKTSKTHHF